MTKLPPRKSAPLPFVGQKRTFLRPFGELLKEQPLKKL